MQAELQDFMGAKSGHSGDDPDEMLGFGAGAAVVPGQISE